MPLCVLIGLLVRQLARVVRRRGLQRQAGGASAALAERVG